MNIDMVKWDTTTDSQTYFV